MIFDAICVSIRFIIDREIAKHTVTFSYVYLITITHDHISDVQFSQIKERKIETQY